MKTPVSCAGKAVAGKHQIGDRFHRLCGVLIKACRPERSHRPPQRRCSAQQSYADNCDELAPSHYRTRGSINAFSMKSAGEILSATDGEIRPDS
jgi:hypothetical protein